MKLIDLFCGVLKKSDISNTVDTRLEIRKIKFPDKSSKFSSPKVVPSLFYIKLFVQVELGKFAIPDMSSFFLPRLFY